ncbi:hypothetical protein GQR58_011220 [Nymphon striatum]|nr:hypothetical protein GQR58_011220 [Nymphon striatum]
MANNNPQPLKRTRSQSDIGSLNINKRININDIVFKNTKLPNSTEAPTPWPRFLVIKGTTDAHISRLIKLSPFAIYKTIISVTGVEPKSVKRLISGDILVETAIKKHTDKLIKTKVFFDIPVTISPHHSLKLLERSNKIPRAEGLQRSRITAGAEKSRVAATNIKKDASTQTVNVETNTTSPVKCLLTETKLNNNKKKNDAKITPTVIKPKNKTEKQKESAIPLPNNKSNVKTNIKTYERVMKPLTPTQLKTSTESIDFSANGRHSFCGGSLRRPPVITTWKSSSLQSLPTQRRKANLPKLPILPPP